jgi:hypothetical protein
MIWLMLFRRHREGLNAWFRAPAKSWERVLALIAAVVVFAIIGLIVRLVSGPLPLLPLADLLRTVALWSGTFAIVGAVLALLFPKPMLCAVYPFSLLEVEIDAS